MVPRTGGPRVVAEMIEADVDSADLILKFELPSL